MPAAVSPARYTLVALVWSTLWASSFIAIKIALRDAPPLFTMGSRFLVAGGVMLAFARLRGDRLPASARDWAPIALMGLLTNALYLGLTSLALQRISAGMGAVLASTSPLLLALVAPWCLGERLTPLKGAGLVLSFSGVAFVMWNRLGEDNPLDAMVAFLACVGFMVAGTVVFKRTRFRHPLLVVNAGQALVGGLALVVPTLVFESLADVRVTRAFLLAQAYLVVVMAGAAMFLWLWLLSKGDATRASAWFFLNPVLGLCMGAAVLGEPLGWRELAGTAAVALGIHVVQRTSAPFLDTLRGRGAS